MVDLVSPRRGEFFGKDGEPTRRFNEYLENLAAQINTGLVLAPDGTVAEPGISFSADTDSGLFRISTNEVGATMGGTLVFSWNTSGVRVGNISELVLNGGITFNHVIKSVDIKPQADNTSDIGTPSRRFKDGHFSGNMKVDGTIDASGAAYVKLPTFTNAGRPDAATSGSGAMIFNSDDNFPNVSDGTNWRDMAGGIT